MLKKLNFRLFSIQNIKRIEFREDINGLRALSVIAVILYHLELPFFEGGWLGVDIFFVISGFLISNIIISEHLEGKFLFKKFYLRRARRLLPSLFFTMLMTIPFSIAILSPKAFKEYTELY